MRGFIVVNSFQVIPPIQYCIDRIIYEFRKSDLEIEIKTTFDILVEIRENRFGKYDFALFYDKETEVCSLLESKGVRVFNPSKSIEECDDKYTTYKVLKAHKIPQPDTMLSPLNYSNLLNDAILYKIKEYFGFPLVIKEVHGSLGKKVYLVNNMKEFAEKEQEIVNSKHIFQKFIKASKGVDYRVLILGHKVVGCIKRESPKDFRSNLSTGGQASRVELPKEFTALAIKVSKILNLDYCGVDLLVDEDGSPLVCEVNSNAFFRGFEQVTNINVARKIVDYIIEVISNENK